MEVILRETIDTLGRAGQVVKVKAGYARNYLLPRKLAYLATPGNLKVIEFERQSLIRKEAKQKGEADQLKGLLDADLLERSTLLNGRTGQRALYALPMGRVTTHVHVWRSLLEEAGFTLADVPKEWEAFWSFWCDEVQPAVRRAMGRDDIWGIGLAMSVDAGDTISRFNTSYTVMKCSGPAPKAAS